MTHSITNNACGCKFPQQTADFDKLRGMTAALADYKVRLQRQLKHASEQNDKEMILLRDTAQHLDRVLQIETERREKQLADSNSKLDALHQKILEECEPKFPQLEVKY